MGGDQAMVVAGEPVRVTRNGRRFFSRTHRDAVVAKCRKPGVSLAAVALANGLNANLVRKWVRQAQRPDCADAAPALLPVVLKEEAPVLMAPAAQASEFGCGAIDGTLRLRVGTAQLQVQGIVDRAQLALVLDTMLRRR